MSVSSSRIDVVSCLSGQTGKLELQYRAFTKRPLGRVYIRSINLADGSFKIGVYGLHNLTSFCILDVAPRPAVVIWVSAVIMVTIALDVVLDNGWDVYVPALTRATCRGFIERSFE